MTEARSRRTAYPEGFVPRVRGAVAPLPPKNGDPAPTKELPAVRVKEGAKKPKDRREHTGEPKPTLPRAFWPWVLLLFVLAVFGIAFLALNNFSFSAFAAMFVIVAVVLVVAVIGFLIAKAKKGEDDHSNPRQGPDKVEHHDH